MKAKAFRNPRVPDAPPPTPTRWALTQSDSEEEDEDCVEVKGAQPEDTEVSDLFPRRQLVSNSEF